MATYNFTVRAEDDRGAFSDRTFSIQVQNNLVDRMLIIDKDHAYASVNGVNFVERTGKGGRRAHYMLNKWVVMNIDNTTYRISDDTINWIEDLKFTTAMDDIKPEHRNITFECDDGTFFEYGGYVYCVGFTTSGGSTMSSKIAIFRTQDWVNWYMVDGSLNFGNLNFAANTLIKHYELSNIVRYNGKFMIYSNRDKSFYLTEDFATYEKKTLINGNLIFNFSNTGTTVEYSRISVVNSVVQIFIERLRPSATSATILMDYFITTDLVNLITPSRDNSGGYIGKGAVAYSNTAGASPSFQYLTPKTPLYYNGSNLFIVGRNGILDTANPLVPYMKVTANDNGYRPSSLVFNGTYSGYIPTVSNLVVFDGKLLGYKSTSSVYSEQTITSTTITEASISGITGFTQLGNRYSDIAVRG